PEALKKFASDFVHNGHSPDDCLASMLLFAQDCPANPPVSASEVRGIYDDVYTPECREKWLAQTTQKRLLAEKKDDIKREASRITDVMFWRKQFMEAHH